jgi:hypothetical protein
MSTGLLEKPRRARGLPRFVPVIFANGEDDDGPGLQACADNEAVQFDDRVFEPGEAIMICGRKLVVRRVGQGVSRGREMGGAGRDITIRNCTIFGS